GIQFLKPVTLGEAHGGGGWRVGGSHKPVPAPEISIAAHQALPWPERRLQRRGSGGIDHPHLRQAAGQGRRSFHILRQRFRPRGKGGRILKRRQVAPVKGRVRLERRVKVIAQGGAERPL